MRFIFYFIMANIRLECGVPPSFQCPKCPYRGHRRFTVQMHLENVHGDPRGSIPVHQINSSAWKNHFDYSSMFSYPRFYFLHFDVWLIYVKKRSQLIGHWIVSCDWYCNIWRIINNWNEIISDFMVNGAGCEGVSLLT